MLNVDAVVEMGIRSNHGDSRLIPDFPPSTHPHTPILTLPELKSYLTPRLHLAFIQPSLLPLTFRLRHMRDGITTRSVHLGVGTARKRVASKYRCRTWQNEKDGREVDV